VGSFLFMRIMSDGEDSRFEKIRYSPPKFAVAFFAQATWVTLCLMPVLAVNSIPATTLSAGLAAFTATDAIGLALYTGGFAFEAIADRQKSQWSQEKKEKKHSEQFLTRGLWSKSRHPNYFGEITLWTGIATVAGGVLCSSAGQTAMGLSGGLGGLLIGGAMAAVSPGFVSFLLTQVSGIPMSEGKYDKRFKGNKDYEAWKDNTPMLIPKLS
jgi:steroid 5-alpha reductase family enzyme